MNPLDPWLSRHLDGMALSDSHASQHGTEGSSSRLPGIRPDSEHINLALYFEPI